jgi:hypothetical protein
MKIRNGKEKGRAGGDQQVKIKVKVEGWRSQQG